MMVQESLPLASSPRAIVADKTRTSPVIWVRRVRFLKELTAGNEVVIRELTLRRGLNVLWARPAATGSDVRCFEGALSGHTAGKSTFCRMMRYLLGEATFGTSEIRKRIRVAFPHGWVIGEIDVAGQTWTVGRPFNVGAHPFAGLGTIDEVMDVRPRRPYQDFLTAVGNSLVSTWGIARLVSDRALEWQHVLPWLTRDQEVRFADFLDWRHQSSESDAPDTLVEERRAIVRAALGLMTDDEQQERNAQVRLGEEKKIASARLPLLQHQAESDRKRLFERLPEAVGNDPPLLWGAARLALQLRKRALDDQVATLAANDEVSNQYQASVDAASAAGLVRQELERVKEAVEVAQGTRDNLTRDASGEADRVLLASVLRDTTLCNVPLATARSRGCPLVANAPIDLTPRLNERISDDAQRAQADNAAALEHARDQLATTVLTAEAVAREARANFFRLNTERAERTGQLTAARAELDALERDLAVAEHTRSEADLLSARLKQIEEDAKSSSATQEGMRTRHAAALSRLSDCFDLVSRAILGTHVRGQIQERKAGLELVIDDRGDRNSPAVQTLKLLAFDLAAMTASVEGHGTFPRFLVHDGPREADMDESTYARLFLYARILEEACIGEPSFQYIVTTTTPPPIELQQAPWLVDPVLDASSASGRLLCVDL